MTKNIFSILLIIYATNGFAQKETSPDNKQIDFSKLKSQYITLHKPDSTVASGCLYSDILVQDSRFDTSTIGFTQRGASDIKSMIKFKNGCSNDIRKYLIDAIDRPVLPANPVSYKLICIIKKLRISDYLYEEVDEKHLADKKPKKGGVTIRVEYLAEKNEVYTPLYRFDTTITGEKDIHRNGDLYIEKGLTLSLAKLSSFTESKIEKIKGKYSRAQIEQYNQQRFNVPILTEYAKRGVFMNFEEFTKNAPSITNFNVVSGKKSDELYTIDASGKETLLNDIYAYSDGEYLFLASSGSFFKLYRNNQTFNLLGAKLLKKTNYKQQPVYMPIAGVTVGLIIVQNRSGAIYNLQLSPFQLDMETGDIY